MWDNLRHVSEPNGAADRDHLVALDDLRKALNVTRRTIDRVLSERGIERFKFAGDRKTYADERLVRAAMAEPQRRPQRKPRPGGQVRGTDGRFAPSVEPRP